MSIIATVPKGSTFGSVTLPSVEVPLWQGYKINLEDGPGFPVPLAPINASLGTSVFLEGEGQLKALQFYVPAIDRTLVTYSGLVGTPVFGRLIQYHLNFRRGETVLGTFDYIYSASVDTGTDPYTGSASRFYTGSMTESAIVVDSRGEFTQTQTTAAGQMTAYDGTTSNPLVLYGVPYLSRLGDFAAEVTQSRDEFGRAYGTAFFNTAPDYQKVPFGFEIPTPCEVELVLHQSFAIDGISGGTWSAQDFRTDTGTPFFLNFKWEGTPRARVSAVRLENGKTLWAREEGGGVVTRLLDWWGDALRVEAVNNTSTYSHPSLSVMPDGTPTRTLRNAAGAIELQKSFDGGQSWD